MLSSCWHWRTVRLASSPPASYGVCRIEPHGLRSALQVLRRIGTGWSTASSASVGRGVYGHFLQRDSRCLTSSSLASRLNETKLWISSEHQSLLRSTQGRRRVAQVSATRIFPSVMFGRTFTRLLSSSYSSSPIRLANGPVVTRTVWNRIGCCTNAQPCKCLVSLPGAADDFLLRVLINLAVQ